MAGKGSTPRPYSVDRNTFDSNWDKIFGKKDSIKYGIKVPFEDGYLWVTIGDSKFQLAPLLFEDKEKAEEHALTVWGENAIVEIYGQDEDSN